MRVSDFISLNPVFSREEFTRAVSTGSRSAASAALGRYLKAGRIGRVRRGVFFTPLPGSAVKSHPVDFLLVASRCASDAVLSHASALSAHGYSRSVYERLIFLTQSRIKRFKFRERPFIPVAPPASLIRARRPFMLVEELERGGLPVRVTTVERTAIDVLDRPDLAGGLEEVWGVLAGLPMLDVRALLEYVRVRGSASLAAKTGLFLERHRDRFAVPEAALAELRSLRPRQPHYFDRQQGHRGKLAAGWNLIVPAALLDGEWEAAQ